MRSLKGTLFSCLSPDKEKNNVKANRLNNLVASKCVSKSRAQLNRKMWVKPLPEESFFSFLHCANISHPHEWGFVVWWTKGKLLHSKKVIAKRKKQKRVELSCTTLIIIIIIPIICPPEESETDYLTEELSQREIDKSLWGRFFLWVCLSVMFETSWNFASTHARNKTSCLPHD